MPNPTDNQTRRSRIARAIRASDERDLRAQAIHNPALAKELQQLDNDPKWHSWWVQFRNTLGGNQSDVTLPASDWLEENGYHILSGIARQYPNYFIPPIQQKHTKNTHKHPDPERERNRPPTWVGYVVGIMSYDLEHTTPGSHFANPTVKLKVIRDLEDPRTRIIRKHAEDFIQDLKVGDIVLAQDPRVWVQYNQFLNWVNARYSHDPKDLPPPPPTREDLSKRVQQARDKINQRRQPPEKP